MPEPTTDSRQPGGSGAGSTEFHPDELCFVCRRNSVNHTLQAHTFITDEHKRTMEELQQLRADLEAARGGQAESLSLLAQLREQYNQHLLDSEDDLAQSRATEAELREKVERRDAVVQAYRPLGAMLYGFGWSTKVPAERLVLEAMKHVHTALVALEAAEQPARAGGGQG